MATLPTSRAAIVRYGRWRNQFIVAPVAVLLSVFFWRCGEHTTGFWVCMVFLSALAVFSVIPSETVLDPERRYLERQWSLFGVLPVFRRRLSLGQFRQVCWRRYVTGESGDWRTWMVGLERNSARPLYISYFNVTHDDVCPEAQKFAVKLSELTGLPLSEEIRKRQDPSANEGSS